MPKPLPRARRHGVAHALAAGSISCALALGAQAQPNAPAPKPAAPAAAPAPKSGKATEKADTSSKRSPAALALERFALTIQRRTLPNGLRVVLAPEPSAPTVAVSVSYGVGSRHEPLGKSGFAHLFEHMMFQGSRHVQKGQHFSLISERGGTLNGTTNTDRTNYFEVLPSGELELALWLESDRMRWLDVSAQNFENQRAVVKEEFRMRIANAAYAPASIRLSELVFANYPPYANPTIGKMEDLDRAELAWVQDFYEHHYAPNAAVLTIAGNFDVDHALDLVDKYFAPIPARTVQPLALPREPPAAAPAREKVEDTNAKTPGVYYAWLIPPSHTSEHYALELLAMLLGDGDSAKLYQELVRKRALALEARAYTRDFVGPDQFTVQLVAADHADLGALEKALDAELAKVQKTPPTEAELERLKQRLRASFVFGLESTLSRAVELGEYELFWSDARNIARELEHYESVSAKDLTAAAQRYLTGERRVVVGIMPESEEHSVSRFSLLGLVVCALGCASPAPLPPPKAAPPAPAPVAAAPPPAPDPLSEPPTSPVRPTTPFPAVVHRETPSGLSLAIVPRRGFPVIELRLIVFSGQATDGALPGVAAVTGRLLKDGGAGRWSSRELAERTEALGARLAIGTDRDSTRISLGVTTGELRQALEILSAVAEQPRFLPDEFQKLKTREIDRVKDRARTSPGWLASMVLYRELYELPVSIHPYARYDALPEEVAALKLADVKRWYKEHFTPENAVLVVTGDVDPDAVEVAAVRAFADWTGKKPEAVSFSEPRGPNGRKILVVDRPGSSQSQVLVGALGPERRSDEYPALMAANQILGGGVAGRLFLDVREKRSLAYSTSSWLEEPAHGPMPIVLSAGTQTPKTAEAVAALLEHYDRMSTTPPSSEELERAAHFLSDSFAFKMETAGAIADLTSRLLVLGLPDEAYDEYRHAVRNLDAETVARTASHGYRQGSLVVVVAGDAQVIAKSLTRFGAVEVLDPEHAFVIEKSLPRE